MSNKTLQLDDRLHEYLLSVSATEPKPLQRIREEAMDRPNRSMQIAPEQGRFMSLLVKMLGAVNTLELGVFTGYSALWTALALPPEGLIVACDTNREYTDIARGFWREAGVEEKIDLRLAPAMDTLDLLIEEGRSGHFDFAFIDADKENQVQYYEKCLQLIRVGGLVTIDNTLWDGDVANPNPTKQSTEAIRELNARLSRDDRIDLSLVPIGDGLTLALKR